MYFKKLFKTDIKEFIELLQNEGEFYAPVKTGNLTFSYKKVLFYEQIADDFLRTILPLKKFLLPPKETLFTCKNGNFYEPKLDIKKTVIFGPHPCDLNGTAILDLLFSNNYKDNYYFKRRNSLFIIGTGCLPDEKCFCKSLNCDYPFGGFDIFLTDLDEFYLVRIGTLMGDKFINKNSNLFYPAAKKDISTYHKWMEKRSSSFKTFLNIDDLPEILEIEYESSYWDEIGDKCLCCGSCSMVCPTCCCFNIKETPFLEHNESIREKIWDSCLFKDFTIVAGGHDFRGRAPRIKNRYYHKQKGFVEAFGKPSCTGCGRCIQFCPAKIDIVEVLTGIRKKLKDAD